MMIKCPECNAVSAAEEWTEGETYCEDCGSHPARVCPFCNHYVDTIYVKLEDYKTEGG